MKVVSIECEYLLLPLVIPVRETLRDYGVLMVTITSDNGMTGTGFARSYDFHGVSVRHIVLNEIWPLICALEPQSHPGRVWHEAAFNMPFADYRSPVGVINSAIGAVDQALWDLWGQHLGEPVYRLLGGARREIDLYATFGLNIYTPEEEAEAARRCAAQGFTAFKLQGVDDRGGNIKAAVRRVERLRETVGAEAGIILDGHNNYNPYEAATLARAIEPYDVAFFDEPLHSRDPLALTRLHATCPGVPLAGRSRSGSFIDNRDLILSGALAVIGSNVMDQGGFSHMIKVAHLAEAYHMPLVTGGAFHLQNSHLIAAVSNGWMSEYHIFAAALSEAIFSDVSRPVGGRLQMSESPGLGLKLNKDAVAEARQRAVAAERKGYA